MEKLRISDNNRYFIREDGSIFPWLADTAWTVPARLKWDDVEYYLQTRRREGFTVLQMVVLDPEYNPDMKNPCGIPALIDGDLSRRNEAYFDYVDWVLDAAEKEGFYVLLLPVWGQLVVGENWSGETFPKTVTEDNAFEYATWLGAREKNRKNILWCLGGDRMPIHKGVDYRNVWRRLAEGLAFGLTGKHLAYNESHEEWKKLMITYHACHEAETGKCSTFSYWTDEEAWISFIMLQSGHGLLPKNYELVAQEYNRSRTMPVWDGEPAYEMMPTGWPITEKTPRHGTYMVRKRAYWSLFAGAFGFTYGHASMWCTISEKERSAISPVTWTQAVNSEGSRQMKILRDFMETYGTPAFTPCQEVLLEQSKRPDNLAAHEQACVNPVKGIMLVYFAKGADETIDVSALLRPEDSSAKVKTPAKPLFFSWFHPATGELEAVQEADVRQGCLHVRLDAAADQTDDANGQYDAILIVANDPHSICIQRTEYGSAPAKEAAKKVFEW